MINPGFSPYPTRVPGEGVKESNSDHVVSSPEALQESTQSHLIKTKKFSHSEESKEFRSSVSRSGPEDQSLEQNIFPYKGSRSPAWENGAKTVYKCMAQ